MNVCVCVWCMRAHSLSAKMTKRKVLRGVFRECCVEDNTEAPQMMIVTESRRQHILSREYFFGGVESRSVDPWRVFAHRYEERR